MLRTRQGRIRNRSPGWQLSASHSAVRVEKWIARARLFLSTDRFTGHSAVTIV